MKSYANVAKVVVEVPMALEILALRNLHRNSKGMSERFRRMNALNGIQVCEPLAGGMPCLSPDAVGRVWIRLLFLLQILAKIS